MQNTYADAYTFISGGSRISHRGAVYPRGGYISKILHVKTKESGPIGGCMPGVPPRSANVYVFQIVLVACECESPL